MIPENCIVPGKDIKGLPLNAVCFEEDLDLVEEFISNETSWKLINDFEVLVMPLRIAAFLTRGKV